ncbi:MAG: septal ring lytic transglycosylase RlpA family protein [Chitinophagaceae bacterium]
MKKAICLLIFCLCAVTFSGIAQSKQNKVRNTKKNKSAKIQYGTASFYSNKFNGRRTASGEIFSQNKLTAAHNSVPLGTWLRVTNLRNKKTVIVKVTDRLHYRNKRLVDLSRAAANKLSFNKSGLLPVKVEVLGKTKPEAKKK